MPAGLEVMGAMLKSSQNFPEYVVEQLHTKRPPAAPTHTPPLRQGAESHASTVLSQYKPEQKHKILPFEFYFECEFVPSFSALIKLCNKTICGHSWSTLE
jgi:hypothetical protein